MTYSNIWVPKVRPRAGALRPHLHHKQNPAEVTNLPVNVHIGTVSGNSGVYIGGRLTIFGLSSHSKSNSGFGDLGDSNVFYHSVSFVYDPDMIDTPIDDRDVHVLQQYPPKGDSSITNIGVGTVWVNTLQQNAGTFIGSTNITGMDSHEKQNVGSGQTYGNQNINTKSVNVTNDQDFVDAAIFDNDNKAGHFFNG
ncbi:hypothetical protein [Alicyclobacillus mengziensis]|uniref:Spore germination protein GerPA/GerPF n=1 Tax=Alicyclobacillus mengziensis TaxID=2931921 RepID=A0A9X7VWT2_9BACL|nr:hypothetical protein [Alicyclobacillus mengziensis]QSO46297.1 hypothetical protein JZ786_17595 [Alicyclobacillus mengziensis]